MAGGGERELVPEVYGNPKVASAVQYFIKRGIKGATSRWSKTEE